ncbi:unnamed protein product [Knipowitschia caucasica]|uniref:BHLH domain-containing protein n=1 Tax=Knipowitschia caucasica TaxID=637954 RepID=A0AAV2LUA4_KNICA
MSFFSTPRFQEDSCSFLLDCNSLVDRSCDLLAFHASSDQGYFSSYGSLSPTSSIDSFSFSPNSLRVKTEQDPLDCFIVSGEPVQTATTTKILTEPASVDSIKKKSRYQGKKRQTASEREKLRMRDLTKALHHLRSYLPTSLAPMGQTLTKIETLRLTIRYISHLSTQLDITQDLLEQRPSGCVESPLFTSSPVQESTFSSSSSSLLGSCAYMVSSGLWDSAQLGWVPQGQHPHMSLDQQH